MKEKMIKLLYYIINPEITPEEKFNYKDLYPLYKFHSLEPFLDYARRLNLLDITKEELSSLSKIYQTALYKTAIQEEELNLIKKTFISNRINFLPLKGSIIRKTYPSLEMRTMADLDILVCKKEIKEVKKLMLNLGYKLVHEGGNHDVYHKLPFMNVEIHRNMIDESYVLSNYYKDIWHKTLKKEETTEYYLSIEDNYLYLIAHSAKHYGAGGTGVRSVLDIYFYLKCYPKMNETYLKNELKKLDLVEYEMKLRALAFGWFAGEKLSLEEQEVGDFIIKSGVYGTISHSLASQLVNIDEGTRSLRYRKWRYLLSRAFPSFKLMKQLYPILKPLPILLPIFYIVRLFKGFFTGTIKTQTKEVRKLSENDILKHQKIKEKTRGKK